MKNSSSDGQHLSEVELSDAETELVPTAKVLLGEGKETEER